jgi:predicted metal-dependent hydrolase
LNTKLIHIPELGEISITRRRQCKRLCISVNRSKSIKVSIPFRLSFSEGERFIFERMDWIKKSIIKVGDSTPAQTIIDEQTEFHTRSRKLNIFEGSGINYKMQLTENEIQICYPKGADKLSVQSQQAFRKLITEAMRMEAKQYLPKRVAELAQIHGFKFDQVKVKNASTRWGSCSYKNNINLNLNLLRLPDELSDYIILHELAHTVQKNHGSQFWDLLHRISGDAKGKALELKRYKLTKF